MNKRPLVSVILPFYNAEKTLERAIRSILDQSYPFLEVILVDNASSDSSRSIANRFVTADKRVTVMYEVNRGVGYAANAGILASSGKYIARMDADDYSFPMRIADQIDFLEKHPQIGVVSGLVTYEGGNTEGFIRYIDWLNSIKTADEISLNRFVELPVVNPSKMCRKEIYEQYGLYELGKFPEDYEFFLRLMSKGVKMGKVDKHVLKWQDSSGRLTRTDASYSQEAFFSVKSAYLAEWLAANNPFHPHVLIWGSGKAVRRKSDFLLRYGVNISGYIDLKKKKNAIPYQEIKAVEQGFILSYVSNWHARSEIRSYLNQKNFVEGTHFLICA